MKILGVSEIDNDAGAVLFVDGELVGAANEERFSRIKLHRGFPERTIDWLLARAGLRSRDLDLVAIVKAEPKVERASIETELRAHDWWGEPGPWSRRALNWLAFRGYKRLRSEVEVRRLGLQIQGWIAGSGIPASRVVRAHHHRAHAAAAYFAAGFDAAMAVTCDGQGGGVSASVYRCSGSTMELHHEVRTPNSMGFFYAMVTRALGFLPARHEGKVTGLAAFEPPSPEALALFREIAHTASDGFVTPGVYGALPAVKRLVKAHGRPAIAAAAQTVLEEVVTSYVRAHARATGLRSVALAGGVFANVKLNQRILELDEVDRLFVFPHMGDGGLGYGAVTDLLAGLQGLKSHAIKHVYWGPSWDEGDLEAALLRSGVDYRHLADIEPVVARLLARGKTVARFAGAMEFGPRALGNRSILHAPVDAKVNDWLNKKLRRSEFMPFAPVVTAEDAPRLLPGLAGAEHAAEFMTITSPCSPELAQLAPAGVHRDGTARPQVLRREVNPAYHAILVEYRRLTGVPALLNTSFNMHEEPIVQSPEDAVRAYVESELDALAIGPFLCERKA